jgi:NAD(P)H dehydrogenase (quinone)
MTTLVTGGTGQFGSLTAQYLVERVPAGELAVSTRDPQKAAGLASLGIEVRQADFGDPASLATAFAGVDKLVLVSANGPDEVRVVQQANAVAAAAAAGVRHIIYTSAPNADTSPLGLAAVHKATEDAIKATGIPYTFLRNGMYHENYTAQLPDALARGAIVTSAGDGRLASVARDDLALAAAAVASTDGHENAVYELTGPEAWTFDEFAALAAGVSGKPFVHKSIPGPDLVAILVGAGLPGFLAEVFVDIYLNVAAGGMAEVRSDLEKLIGRPGSPLVDAVRAALS